MKKSPVSATLIRRSSLLALALLLGAGGLATAKPRPLGTDAPERKAVLDGLRSQDSMEKFGQDQKAKVVFVVHALWLDGELALADVTPQTDDKHQLPRQLAFLLRGGRDPWVVVGVGKKAEAEAGEKSWVGPFLAKNPDCKDLWAAFQQSAPAKGEAPAKGAAAGEASELGKDAPERAEILNALRSLPLIADLAKERGQKIIFRDVKLQRSGDWVWANASPSVEDNSWNGEPLVGLMHLKDGHWSATDFVPDEVNSADDADAAYAKWRGKLLKENPGCPPALVPKSL